MTTSHARKSIRSAALFLASLSALNTARAKATAEVLDIEDATGGRITGYPSWKVAYDAVMIFMVEPYLDAAYEPILRARHFNQMLGFGVRK